MGRGCRCRVVLWPNLYYTPARRNQMSQAVLPRLHPDRAPAQLPGNPNQLLTPVEQRKLAEDLAELAELRRDAETASASLRLA